MSPFCACRNFSNGLLSLRSSLLTSGLSGTDVANHLRTFLISHGVPSSNRSLNDLLSRLTSGMLPTVSTNVVEVLPVRGASVSAITAHSESVTIAPRRTSTQSGDDNTGVGCYTRFQTPMFEAIGEEVLLTSTDKYGIVFLKHVNFSSPH